VSVAETEHREAGLPEPFRRWFAARGWRPRPYQIELLEKARAGRSTLLIAPTGAGKTLAGFLPTLVELSERRGRARPGRIGAVSGSALHTLYISPLKALAVDVARNLDQPVAEMGLPIRIETRTGDTPTSKRARQRRYPPDILLTTPEQLALLLSTADAPFLFATVKRVVLDELHSLVISKRGDLLALGLARLQRIAPGLTTIGLSATVANPDELCRYLVPQNLVPQDGPGPVSADLLVAGGGAAPVVHMLDTAERLPWAGHSARHALGEIYELIKRHRTTLMFVNTRSQAEMLFQELWRINDDGLAIALHHGSLDVAQRRKVEAAMAAGRLQGVVCTSSLDLGIDWGDVDLVINVGAPKGASRLTQRIGRANHRLDEPSHAVLVPANRFEVLECQAAIEAVAEGAQDTPPLRTGAFDVLAQHVLGCACGAPFWPGELYEEVRGAAPFAGLARADFDAVVDFVATGGYALKVYERFAKIRPGKDGRYRISHPRIAQQYRLNVGTIVEETMIKVRLVRSRHSGQGPTGVIARGGRVLGELEEYFIEGLTPGDTFVFSGEILQRPQGAGLCGRQVPAVDLSGGAGAGADLAAHRVAGAARASAGMARHPAMALPGAAAGRVAGRDLSARRQELSRLLSVRGAARPSDSRHAAHPPARTRPPASARLRGQ
jgi:ATP-dependent Lhr-like helicase